jgi:hypothetical protein
MGLLPTTAPTMKFTHQPLDSSLDSIRLVCLHARQIPSSLIHCTIHYTNLTSAPPFKALSHIPSPSSPSTPAAEIQINNHPFRVHANLHTLLEQLHDQLNEDGDEETWYWIDQLCIDGANAAEKSHQVGLRHRIYRSAAEVLVWLGPAAERSDVAMRAVGRVSGARGSAAVAGDGEGPLEVVAALQALFARLAWKSVWRVQEVVLARRVVVLCGRVRLGWERFNEFFVHPDRNEVKGVLGRMFYTKTRRYSKLSMSRFLGAQHVMELIDSRYRFLRGWRPAWDSLSSKFSKLECEDPRDWVYALQGLLPGEEHVVVDYARPLEEVVFDVFQKLRESTSDNEWYWDIVALSRLTSAMNVRQHLFHGRASRDRWSRDSEEDAVKTLLLADRFDPNWKDADGETLLIWAVSWDQEEVVKLLLAMGRVDIHGAPETIAQDSSAELMALLLDQRGSEVPITDALIEAAMSNECHAVEMIMLLLDKQESNVTLTEAIVRAAATNRESGNEAMVALLERPQPDIALTEETIEVFVRDFDDNVMDALVAARNDTIAVTETIIKAAIANKKYGSRILETLLDRRETDLITTSEIVETLAREFSGKAMKLALDRFGAAPLVTETVLLAAARNQAAGHQVIAVLLGYRGLALTVTGAVIEAVARNPGCGGRMMKVLLSQPGAAVVVTETVVKVAGRNKRGGAKVMRVLVGRKGAGVDFTDGAKAAMGRCFRWIGRTGC